MTNSQNTRSTEAESTVQATKAPRPLTFHITASQDDTHLHTFCGDTIRKATAIRGESKEQARRPLCSQCAEMKRLDKQFTQEMQQELHVLKRYEVMLSALRELQAQEEQS